MNKLDFRKSIRGKGRNIDASIIESLLKDFAPYNNADQILVYLALKDEVDLTCIINNKEVLVPYLDNDMYFTKYSANLVKGMYNIEEPEVRISETIKANAIAFIPGLAFDKNFNRMGRGKGYYDKFLVNKDIIKVGVIHSSLLFDSIPAEEHDIKMDYILTEKGILSR